MGVFADEAWCSEDGGIDHVANGWEYDALFKVRNKTLFFYSPPLRPSSSRTKQLPGMRRRTRVINHLACTYAGVGNGQVFINKVGFFLHLYLTTAQPDTAILPFGVPSDAPWLGVWRPSRSCLGRQDGGTLSRYRQENAPPVRATTSGMMPAVDGTHVLQRFDLPA